MRGMAQEFMALALRDVEPVAVQPAIDPDPFQIAGGRALDRGATCPRSEMPYGIHLVMLGQHAGKAVALAGDESRNSFHMSRQFVSLGTFSHWSAASLHESIVHSTPSLQSIGMPA